MGVKRKHALSGGPDAGEYVYDRPYVYERTHAGYDVWQGRFARIRILRSRAHGPAAGAILHRMLSTARQRGGCTPQAAAARHPSPCPVALVTSGIDIGT